MEHGELLLERMGDGAHLCADGWNSSRLWALKGQVRLAIVDLPTAAHTSLMWRAGADDWLHNRSSITFTLNHTRMDGPQEALQALRETLRRVNDLLHGDGSVYVFLDPRLGPAARIACDEIFGRAALRNEIIWAHGGGKRPRGHFTRSHDTMLFYVKGKGYFNPDAVGRVRGAQPTNHMRRGVDERGRVYFARVKGSRELRYFEDDVVSIGDVWTDIEELKPRDAERTGWEGQRPEVLIQRILLASSRPGDVVLDACCGAATVAAAAQNTGRRAVAVAENPFERLFFRRRLLENSAASYAIEHPLAPMTHGTVRFARGEAHLPPPLPWTLGRAGANGPDQPGLGQGYLLDDGGTLDGWLAGRLQEHVLRVHGYSLRTRANPALRLSLPIGEPDGVAAALLCDAGAQVRLGVSMEF